MNLTTVDGDQASCLEADSANDGNWREAADPTQVGRSIAAVSPDTTIPPS